MIEALGLTKDYGRFRAVDDVSFEVGQGEIVGLLGPNGSGKTTIMRMLTGFFPPTAGRCRVAGIDMRESPREARRHIGYLPEHVALYPDMTVQDFLAFVARVRSVSGSISIAVYDAMEVCNLGDMAKRRIGNLSKGYRQRVGIAQAIIHQPDVLILDEPTVGLDPRQIVEIRELIRNLADLSTVLLSTHILPEVSVTCRRVLILDHGELIATDTAEGLSRKTAGRGELLVRLRANESEALALLRGVPGVRSAEVLDRGPGPQIGFVVTCEAGVSVQPEIVRQVVGSDWDLVELTPKLMSLEDLFVRILDQASRRGKKGAAA